MASNSESSDPGPSVPRGTKRKATSDDAQASSSASTAQSIASAEIWPEEQNEEIVNPTEVKHIPWVFTFSPNRNPREKVLGKWLVFRSFAKLDSTWHRIRNEIKSGSLTDSVCSAKCSTMFQFHNSASNVTVRGTERKGQGVICVYTTEEDIDIAGYFLINMLRHDIRYKTDEATYSGRYSKQGGPPVTLKTLYWNAGNPCFEKSKTKSTTSK